LEFAESEINHRKVTPIGAGFFLVEQGTQANEGFVEAACGEERFSEFVFFPWRH
jgi:hypothetical protein